MRAKHLIVGLLVAVATVVAMAAPASAAGFTDIEDSPYETSINALAYREYIGGYADGTFRPDNPLQRQQFAKMAVLTMGYEVTPADVSTFKDTPTPYDPVNNPLYPGAYVAVASRNGIIRGYPDNTFRFANNVTRQQAITMIVRAAGAALADPPADYKGVLSYADPDHGPNIKKAEFNGLLAGIPDLATWDATKNATRGEAAEVLAQLFYRTGVLLSVTGPSGTQEFTMAQLKALQPTEGYGGWRNVLGNITGPKFYRGISIRDLMDLVGGGTKITATASDGYEQRFDAAAVSGNVEMYDPITGAVITAITGQLTMILAYGVDGEALASDEGGLRIAFVSDQNEQVTPSGNWVKQVVAIRVE